MEVDEEVSDLQTDKKRAIKCSDNFDDYMKAVGVGWALRKAGAMASSTTEITQEAEGIRVNTQSTVKSSNFVFPDNKAVEYTTMDGRKTMVCVKLQN